MASDLEKAARNVILSALDQFPTTPVIYYYPQDINATEPAETYIVIQVVYDDSVNQGQVSTLTTENKEIVFTGTYEARIQYSFIGSLSSEISKSCYQRIGVSPIVLETISKNKLSYMRKTTLRDAPQKRDIKWIKAKSMDVIFSYNLTTVQPIDYIEAVQLKDELTGKEFIIPPNYTP